MENNNLNSQINLQQKLEAIGTTLYQIRINKNISLDEIAAKTLISKRLLLAIETGNLEELPEPVYTQALIVKFSRAIGVTESEVDLNLIPPVNPTNATSNIAPALSSVKSAVPKPSFNFQFNFQLRSLHLYLLYILLVIVSVISITNLVERPIVINEVPEEKPALNTQVADSGKDTNITVNNNQPSAAPQFVSQATDAQTVMVGINLAERCWLKVMVDGNLAFEGTLPAGTQRTWTGKEQVTIRAGNAGGVAVTFNNGQKQILGKPGQVQEVTYTVN
ncbi:MAG: helix-turn-helix domain-containing protein [Pleurocapsa sp.]